MRVCAIFLVLTLLLLASFGDITVEAQATELDPNEMTALRAMAKKLDIQFWNFSLNPCSGQGEWNSTKKPIEKILTCNCSINNISNYCHVTNIKLKTVNLTGPLPEELVNLTSLTEIDFSRNSFSGTIPLSWASLPLTILGLLGNRVTGPIPEEIGTISTLQQLILDSNLFNGSVPSFLGNLPSLKRLLLSGNQFTGVLPDSLGDLTNLEDFRIDGNAISGRIPVFFANWTKMERLDIQGTSLQGPFPPGFSSLTNLSELRVTDINISGTFPEWETLKSIKYLILRNCQLSGSIPPFIGNMKNLARLDLSFNNFTGPIPERLKDLEKIDYLYLTNNMLSGSDLSYNYFEGTGYQTCQLSNVNIVASYSPSEKNLKSPCLSRNPTCPGKSMNYELYINCGGEEETVEGKVYKSDKTAIDAASIYSPSSDRTWALSSTGYFVGDIKSPYIGAINESLLLNTTNSQLYKSARLNPLSLRYYALCMQSGNYTVNLHFAEIMFSEFGFSSDGRRIFDVSIQGKKVLENFDITKKAGGVRRGVVLSFTTPVENTLEIHFRWLGKGTMSIPTRGSYGPLISAISITPNFTPKKENSGGGLSNGAVAGIVVGTCTFLITIVSIIYILLGKKHVKSKEHKALESMAGYFSLRHIKTATQNFAPENKIGEGGFGSVYKGTLIDGTIIAVKQLSSKSRQGNREFINEVGMISALHHPNLVKLFGCCVEGNQLLVVYEYMENNSLARALFGPEEVNLNLNWPTRSKICIDIARGLAYLHEESMIKIVHRDIKATNVLLDSDLNAKISDFGLAKLDEGEDTHISTRIAGTIGYMAPEYAMRGYLTDKADVYSFGIVVLEIISGKSNTNFRPKEDSVYLLDLAYVLQEKGRILELVDSSMDTNYSKEEAYRMLNLALLCTIPSPSLRPKMSTVVSMLEGKTPVSANPIKIKKTESEILRYKAFESLSQDRQTFEVSTTAPWTNSTMSTSSGKDESATSLNPKVISPLINLE
ncbi:putative Protein kinase [Zostera marina]|uniref:non-specific serine/threonine protein kinase n=1 Tax=Zostera marina TaxID=29655 RepID=A0A0K9PY78_ZOSMR|nr:putative Protein kinase [Zostera marina]